MIDFGRGQRIRDNTTFNREAYRFRPNEDPFKYPIGEVSCIYFEGEHIRSGPNCPHGKIEAEEIPGWTVQQ